MIRRPLDTLRGGCKRTRENNLVQSVNISLLSSQLSATNEPAINLLLVLKIDKTENEVYCCGCFAAITNWT